MGHQDKDHYAKKHPHAKLDHAIAPLIQQAENDGILACADAHRIAKQTHCTPEDIGIQADLLELRLSKCQLGLFGCISGNKNFNPDARITLAVRKIILEKQSDGRIDCKTCWDIAKECKISRIDMGTFCEQLEIRIKPCQLGAF